MVIFYIFSGFVLLFGFVLAFGAPYVPTFRRESVAALNLLDLKPGQTLYELGCGDGRVLKAAARRGLKAVGYELNPFLALTAYINTWRYRKQVKIVCRNFWNADLKEADGVYVFLIDRFMKKLDAKIAAEKRPVRLVSYAFKIPGKEPAKARGAMFLYEYK